MSGPEGWDELRPAKDIAAAASNGHDDALRFTSTGKDPVFLLPPFPPPDASCVARVELTSPSDTLAQIFFRAPGETGYCEKNSVRSPVAKGRNVLHFELDKWSSDGPLRFDPGQSQGDYTLHSFEIRRVVGFDHRAYVGPFGKYDLVSACAFGLLGYLGLREHHHVLDIGCGALRIGRLLMVYLLPGRYFGIEPNRWLVDDGIRHEIGEELIAMKRPQFSYDDGFNLTRFEQTFDFILAQSIFSHTSLGQMRHTLREAAQVMTPSSIFAATYLKGEEDYAGDTWVYPEGVYFRPETVARESADAGLGCLELNWHHPNGQTWVAIGHERSLREAIPKMLLADR